MTPLLLTQFPLNCKQPPTSWRLKTATFEQLTINLLLVQHKTAKTQSEYYIRLNDIKVCVLQTKFQTVDAELQTSNTILYTANHVLFQQQLFYSLYLIYTWFILDMYGCLMGFWEILKNRHKAALCLVNLL